MHIDHKIIGCTIPGDIGCYALAYGPPWNAMDTAICMGSSLGIALGIDKARGDSDPNRRIVAVLGDSTFLHTGMPGLLNIVYNGGNVNLHGTIDVYGQFLSDGDINLVGSPTIYGSLVTDTKMNIGGSPDIFYRQPSVALTTLWQEREEKLKMVAYSEW